MANSVSALEAAEPVLSGDGAGVAQVFDQFERAAERQDFGTIYILYVTS